jgi:Peptidase M16 inactive domain
MPVLPVQPMCPVLAAGKDVRWCHHSGTLQHRKEHTSVPYAPTWWLRPVLAAGKGMHSRLYSRVLNKHGWVQQATAFTSIYDHAGLVGISAAVDADRAGEGVDLVASELLSIASGGLAAEEVGLSFSHAVGRLAARGSGLI